MDVCARHFFASLHKRLVLCIPWLLRGAIQSIQRGIDPSGLAKYALAIIGIALVQAVIRTASRLQALGATRYIVTDARDQIYAKLLRLDAPFYDRSRTGDIMSRAVNDLRVFHGLFGPAVMYVADTVIVYVAVFLILFFMDPKLTLMSLLVYPPLYYAVNRISRKIYRWSMEVQEQLGKISNYAQENISGNQHVKIYAQEDREIDGFADLCRRFRDQNLKMTSWRALMMAMIGLAAGAGTLLVFYVGGSSVAQGKMTLGDFVAFNAYLAMLIHPTIALGWVINSFQRGITALRRVGEILNADSEIPSPLDSKEDSKEEVFGDIEIRDLTFSYTNTNSSEQSTPVFKNLSLFIKKGQSVAIVGEIGSGKSTLAHLLTRMYAPADGTIFIDGKDINQIPSEQLRRSVGFVPQEAFLFSRSLRENLVYGDPSVLDDVLDQALVNSGLKPDLGALPKGIDTVVGERGFTLSGGQRQRSTLARALSKRPRIFIADDALSSVDAKTEHRVLKSLQNQDQERTSIFITHRLSSFTWVDRIFVLGCDGVCEEGTHAELLLLGGTYARLYRTQALYEKLAS